MPTTKQSSGQAPADASHLRQAAFHHQREMRAPAEAVFAAIAAPERLARWWGPDGFSNTIEKFDFTPGGQWHLTMHGPNGANYPNQSVFREIIPNASVVIEHLSQPHFVLSIALTPTETGTLVSWVQEFDNPAIAASIEHIVDPANEQNLTRWEQEVVGLAHPVLSPLATYLHLTTDGKATPIPGGEQFWAMPPEQLDALGKGWLVSEFEFDADWPSWEMHPEADELVYVLSGTAQILLEMPEGVATIDVTGPGLVVVPRGIWHTARVATPCRFLHVTMGVGTQVRPA